MAGSFQFTGSLIQSGSVATFKNGITVTGSLDYNASIASTFFGDGSSLTGLTSQGSSDLLFGGEVVGSNINLSASALVEYDHYTFMKDKSNGWEQISDYLGNANGLQKVSTCIDINAYNGINRYLLLAVNTSSLKTSVIGTTVVK